MSDLSWIFKRKSVRNYLDKPVSRENLEWIVKAGMAAPCAMNKQLWEFVVIDDETVLHQLGNQLPYAKMALHAKAGIVVCGNVEKTYDGDKENPTWIMDCSAATENILLAVEALGLGAVWTAVYPDTVKIENVRKIVGLPEQVIPLNMIPIGYPAKEEFPKEKWNEAAVHWNQW
jgi:nitroreductase